MARSVYLLTRDLLFRSKLAGLITAAGAETTRDAAVCDQAVVELGAAGWEDRLRELVGRGVPTLAFGPHLDGELLRRARATGATAVPNSQVEERLRAMLEAPK
jgi:hypothetical protein